MKVYKASRKRKKTMLLFALSFLSLLISLFLYIFCIVDPIIVKSTYAQIETQATSYVSDAIKDALLDMQFDYDDFMSVTYNNEGNVASMSANTTNINLFAREVAIYSQKYIDKIIDEGVKIPIGNFTGLNFLAGRGVKINFKLVPIGSIHVGFNSEFEEAGINQTRHSLSIVVTTNMTIVMPLSDHMIEFKTDFKVCENLIVGEVPNIYLNGNLV